MPEYLFFIGREPELSVAELEARADEWDLEILEIQPVAVLARATKPILPTTLDRLGGCIKLAEVIECFPKDQSVAALVATKVTSDWLHQQFPTGRIEFGFSLYGASQRERAAVQKTLLRLKQELKKGDQPVRLVTSREPELSAVTVMRQGLLKHGKEFVFYRGQQYDILGRTIAVQDYQGYGWRDFGRPRANPKSGMIPPKLAQILLNLAQVKPDDVLLDPFCGSGTLLQEAVLLGVKEIHGSDAEARAVADSQENIRWLFKEFPDRQSTVEILKRDVADRPTRATVVVTEPALGKPLRGHESASGLNDQMRQLEKMYLAGFRRWAEMLPLGGRVVMIWPEYIVQGQLRSPQIDAAVTELGFNLQPILTESASQALAHPERSVLRYGRPDALVRRQIRKWIYTPTAT